MCKIYQVYRDNFPVLIIDVALQCWRSSQGHLEGQGHRFVERVVTFRPS